jgi:hypothetical protein
MRIQRSVQLLTVLTTLAALGACASYGREQQSDPQVTTVADARWDSGPLDRDYARERTSMDNRHQQEIDTPRADESSDQRVQRHASENDDLQRRYESGKVHHTQTLPPSDRKGHDEKPNEQPHQ